VIHLSTFLVSRTTSRAVDRWRADDGSFDGVRCRCQDDLVDIPVKGSIRETREISYSIKIIVRLLRRGFAGSVGVGVFPG
jgi:hypothetical protein